MTAVARVLEPGIVYCDAAVGSRELQPILSQRFGCPSEIYPRLPADFAILGQGRGKNVWRCGVERKTLSDLGSSLLMGRFFSLQLPRMLEEYDRVWLIVEGVWRVGDDNETIETWGWNPRLKRAGWVESRVPLTWAQLQSWLLTYDEFAGPKCHRWRTNSMVETAAWLSLWRRWWKKPYHTHAGHIAIEQNTRMPTGAHLQIRKPNIVQEAAFAYPTLGARTALKVGRHFASIEAMTLASVEEWRKAGLGKASAKTVYDHIRRRIR